MRVRPFWMGDVFFCSSSKQWQLRHLRSFKPTNPCRRRLTCWERWTSQWWRAPTEPWWWGSGTQTPRSQCPWTWGYSRCTAWSVSADRHKEFTQQVHVCAWVCVSSGPLWPDLMELRCDGGNSCRTSAWFPPCVRNQTISVRGRGRRTSPRAALKWYQSHVLRAGLTRPSVLNVPAGKTWLGGPRRQTGTTTWQRRPSQDPHILLGEKTKQNIDSVCHRKKVETRDAKYHCKR